MKLIDVVIEGEYTIEYYDNGTINQYLTPTCVEPGNPVEPEPTEQEIIQAEILLNQAKILAKLNALEV